MEITLTDPNIIDLWHEGEAKPKGRTYRDSIIKVEDMLFQNSEAFVLTAVNHPQIFGLPDDAQVTGVRINGLGADIFYKNEEGAERDHYVSYEHVDMTTVVNI
jgi:hypothetical protein